jgi:hypothetical protein
MDLTPILHAAVLATGGDLERAQRQPKYRCFCALCGWCGLRTLRMMSNPCPHCSQCDVRRLTV